MTPFQQKVYNIVRRIPRGKVMTYAVVAKAIKKPKAVRAVGNALNKNSRRSMPCHRVVKSDGSVGGYNEGIKRKLFVLRKDGVRIKNGFIDLKKFLWIPRKKKKF